MTFGIFNPFEFHKGKGVSQAIYYINKLDVIIDGSVTLSRVDVNTGAETPITPVSKTWDINGVSYSATRFTEFVAANDNFYLKLVKSGVTYWTGIVNYAPPECINLFIASNTCSDQHYDWATDSNDFAVYPYNGDFQVGDMKDATVLRIRDGVEEEETTSLKQVQRLVFTAPKAFYSAISALRTMEEVLLDNRRVVNIQIERSEVDAWHDTFTIKYEYATVENSSCCEVINIDDIIIGNTGACGSFAVTISNTSGLLSAVITDEPVGSDPLIYSWYKNNALVGSGSTYQTSGSGTFKLVLKKGSCRATDSTTIANACEAFTITPYQTGNDINANFINPPAAYTVSVKLLGSEVATSLPYTALADGVYYIYITETGGNECEKSAGINVSLVEDVDFTIGITRDDLTLTAVTNGASPNYQWKLETPDGVFVNLGTDETQEMTSAGNYHLEITVSGVTKTDYFLYLAENEALAVRITNPVQLSNGSGVVQTIENTAGNVFDLDYQDVRWLYFRNGVEMTYRPGVAASAMDVNDYDVVGDQLITTSVPGLIMTVDDIIERKPI